MEAQEDRRSAILVESDMTAKEQKKAAAEFAAQWAGRGYEKGECGKFWRSLLRTVFGIDEPDDWVDYEVPVNTGFTTRFIDAYIPRTQVLIEQKSFTKDLTEKQVVEQALLYVGALPDTMPVRYIVLCNFQEFIILDKHAAQLTPVKVTLKDLPKKLSVLRFLTEVQASATVVRDVAAVDKKAGELVGRLYEALLKSYSGELDERTLESLNMLCVRLVFCAYAEDAGVFPKRDQFVDYMRRFDAESLRDRLAQLFRMLNTDYPDRDPDDIPDLLDFPYVGSGLFDDEHIRIPRFTEETRKLLLDCMCADLDWTDINPTIFGAVFESTLSTTMRRKNGMHYTTVKNIHRVADPLFLWALERELDEIAAIGNLKKRNEALVAFQRKLGKLIILDPACGSGNFLTETYISLRRLENRAIMLRQQGQSELDLGDVICVTIDQFYGIEIDGFAVSVAQTALWIAESQMMIETEKILHRKIDFLPLRRYAHIVKGNALRMDWNVLLAEDQTGLPGLPGFWEDGRNNPGHPENPVEKPMRHFSYILGNPPFRGARNMGREDEVGKAQKEDVEFVFSGWKNNGNRDYVTCWHKKAADLIGGTATRCAFVSTNSVCQGESVPLLWKPLFESGIEIDFAWKTFVWDSEATEQAHVHVVIVGFHAKNDVTAKNAENTKILLEGDGSRTVVHHINGYLVDGPDVFVESRKLPLCDVPVIGIGNKPIDGGNYLFTRDERDLFIAQESQSAQYFHPFLGADEFINGKERFCLWLGDCSPGELRRLPACLKRVEAVRNYRLASPSAPTRKLADRPTRFHVENMPKGHYLVIPQVSSQRREYVPMGYLDESVICSDKLRIAPNASLYHFGVLNSSVHMAWMRVICCRLKSDYSYTINNVYNCFPWPDCLGRVEMKKCREEKSVFSISTVLHGKNEFVDRISATAQAILCTRALYPDSSLADLYDPLTMPPELRRAHQANDAAVLAAYGFPKDATEAEIVSRLFEMYVQMTAEEKG